MDVKKKPHPLVIQKRGPFGNINRTGAPDSPSALIPHSHPKFHDNIEAGILTVVKTAILSGFDTFSSCEGHIYPRKRSSIRHVGVIIEKNDTRRWIKAVHRLNKDHGIHLVLNMPSGSDFSSIQTRPYKKPTALNILIGYPEDSDIEYKTAATIALLKSLAMPVTPKR